LNSILVLPIQLSRRWIMFKFSRLTILQTFCLDFGSSFSGILTDEQGRVQALWASFSTQVGLLMFVTLPVSWGMVLACSQEHIILKRIKKRTKRRLTCMVSRVISITSSKWAVTVTLYGLLPPGRFLGASNRSTGTKTSGWESARV